MLRKLLFKPNNKYVLEGTVSNPKFQPLSEAFEKFFKEGYDYNAQLSVYFEGDHVVDLFGHTPNIFNT